jgi:hypothetical protein
MLKSGVAVVLLLAAVSHGSVHLREYTAVSVTGCRACWRVNRALVTACELQSGLGAVAGLWVFQKSSSDNLKTNRLLHKQLCYFTFQHIGLLLNF